MAKPVQSKTNFILVLMLIGASAAVGIYRNQRSAQVFSKPLFEPVAPTEVITASEIIGKNCRERGISRHRLRGDRPRWFGGCAATHRENSGERSESERRKYDAVPP